VPHLAVAIALGFLVMPTGMMARLLAYPLAWTTPPDWITTHDPYGVLLVIALTLKETPFLTYVLLAHLRRDDVKLQFTRQAQVARSLGHGQGSIWARIFLPQLIPVLAFPLLVVFSYAATVVDLSLAIGPTQPSTLSTIIWADLNSSDPLDNARGAAGAFALTAAIAILASAIFVLSKLLQPAMRSFCAAGPSALRQPLWASINIWRAIQIFYVLLLACLIFLSFTRLWPFPDPWPRLFNAASWQAIIQSPGALATSLVLGLLTSFSALAFLLLWFETQSRSRDKILLVFALLALALPVLVIGLGQYQMLLYLGLSSTGFGLYLVHLMPVFAYMFLILAAPYRSFDARWNATANSLHVSSWRFLFAVKWPLLRPQLLAALAIGFAVSFGQYVPAQIAAAGRYSTLPMEAVTLTSGANRPLTAAFALLLGIVPVVVFMIAARASRPRWGHA
jgi:putative thiamine transport system permease protein